MGALQSWYGRSLRFDFSAGRSPAIPIEAHEPQLRFYVATTARVEPFTLILDATTRGPILFHVAQDSEEVEV